MVTIEYPCADGTLLPVTFDSEEHAARSYRREVEHMPECLSPLAAALERLGSPGGARAYDEVGLYRPPFFEPGPDAKGFAYFPDGDFDAELMGQMMEGLTRLVNEHGSALGLWRQRCLPRTQEACRLLDEARLDIPIHELAEHQAYGLQMTMMPAYVCGNDMRLLTQLCAEVTGEDGGLLASELAQGYENETLRADRELWLLGRGVAGSPEVMAALSSTDPTAAMGELRRAGSHAELFAAIDAFLDEFGKRAEGWDSDRPTWNEQRNGFWCQLRQIATSDARDPAEAIAAGAGRREALLAELDVRLADDEEKRAKLHRRVGRVAAYVAVREERAYWQLRITGSLRHAVLRRGDVLVAAGLIEDRDDIRFLLPDEIESASSGGELRQLVAARRAEHERWSKVSPPEIVGGDPVKPEIPKLPGDGIVRGAAASRGVVTGTARVITDLCDADRVEAGDVLVCAMTSPPWTPLFGIVSAVVVDSGDVQSHPGIAAREYGIPCVLGTKVATTVIPDGATVVVDGDQGTVEVLAGSR